ncbi:MAG TPA: hypothetical protein VHA73_05200 [Acidimicrobiales bacterium]|jgi:hypothetical protein|nr:hypothetical protein [Acidimicrobiales bacterium]
MTNDHHGDDGAHERGIDELLAIRKPGAHLDEEVVADDFVLMLGVDLNDYPKFDRVDDAVTYPKAALDIRQELDVDSGAELPDYSGPWRADLRFTDFSVDAIAAKLLPWSQRYLQLCVDGWAAEVTKRYGADTMAEIEWTAWNDQVVPELERMRGEFLPAGTPYTDPNQSVAEDDRATTRVQYTDLFSPRPDTAQLAKTELVTWFLGSHEYLLQCIEAWATQITVRYGLDVMFDIQWTLWGDTVLPGAKRLKAEYLGINGNTVADWMKDLQMDATALPGKAFDVSFEMPEPDTGIMTFNRCVAVDQWEAMGRPDILEKNCHSTCPKSMIVTTKMYNPNMRVDILAIPPRKDPGDVCCKWRFSMRSEDDPEYVPIELTSKPGS